MKVANGAMITTAVQEIAIMDTIYSVLLTVIRKLNTVLNRLETNVSNAKNLSTGKAGTGSSVLNVNETVKFVMRTPLIAISAGMGTG